MRTILLLLFALIGFGGCYYPVAGPDGSVSNQNTIRQINEDNYAKYLFSTNDANFQDAIIDINFENNDANDEYLKTCGGLLPQGHVLTDEQDQTIASKTDLLSKIVPIQTPEQAMAYVYATSCYLNPSFLTQYQFVNKNTTGYLVSVIRYNPIGCGRHAHTRLFFDVTYNGEISLVKTQVLEWGSEYCGD